MIHIRVEIEIPTGNEGAYLAAFKLLIQHMAQTVEDLWDEEEYDLYEDNAALWVESMIEKLNDAHHEASELAVQQGVVR